MTEMNKFNAATAAMQNQMRGAGFRKSAVAVNLMQEFSKRGVNVQNVQIEK